MQAMDILYDNNIVEIEHINNINNINNINTISINDEQYKKYKKSILGKNNPSKSDDKCDHYLLNNFKTITLFSNIKTSAINTQLNTEHINNIVMAIEKNNELYFPNPIALIEYTDYKTDSVNNLIEIIDGHHRLECIKILLEKKTCSKMAFWVQIYKSSSPTDKKTTTIFKIFNNIKPFGVNFTLIDLKNSLVEKLNAHFKINIPIFILIKDAQHNVNRPSIQKKLFCDMLEKRINNIQQQTQVTQHELYLTVVDNIVNNFISYNTTLYDKEIGWFNNKYNKYYSGHISDKQFATALANKCMLGFINIEFLMEQCIYL